MVDANSHGGDIYSAAEQLRCAHSEIIDFSSNINVVAPTVKLELTPALIGSYGDPRYTTLRNTIARRYGLETEEIALFNGASSAIMELFRFLRPKRSYLYTPIYGEYVKASELYSRKTRFLDRFSSLYKKPKKGSTVVFVNPSTPDGRHYDLERLFTIWREARCTVIVDESFLEFSKKPSVRKMIKEYKRLYIVHSFTKFYACAGLRVGALFSRPENIDALALAAWNISSFDAAYVTELLSDPDHRSRSLQAHQKQYKELRSILKGSGLFEKVYKSDANFILTRSAGAPAIYEALFREKILVRDCANFDGLDRRYLRFAVKDKTAHQTLQKALHALS
jgi:threonine-phosphate decarboxylase